MNKTSNLIILIFCFSAGMILNSCDKYHVKKLSGTYNCQVHYNYWVGTTTIIDTIYDERVVVTREGQFVKVLDYKIHIDSLWKEKEYSEGDYQSFFKIQFTNDNLLISRYGIGLGAGVTWQYNGTKEN
jgi:hypothetical protein